jgi:hypothetical protein
MLFPDFEKPQLNLGQLDAIHPATEKGYAELLLRTVPECPIFHEPGILEVNGQITVPDFAVVLNSDSSFNNLLSATNGTLFLGETPIIDATQLDFSTPQTVFIEIAMTTAQIFDEPDSNTRKQRKEKQRQILIDSEQPWAQLFGEDMSELMRQNPGINFSEPPRKNRHG